MKNLGEKLTEARNAMGLSVRDVADQTRLRIDDIEKMESGEFNINLPEIYRRGFLKIYAAFLKLNVDEVLAEYTALQAARAGGHKPKRLLERIAANSPKEVEPPSPVDSRYGDEDEAEPEQPSDEQGKYIKLGAIFAGVILTVVVIIFGVSALVRPNVPEENPDLAASAPVATQPAAQPAAPVSAPVKENLLTVSALRDTYVTVFFINDKANPLYTGSLAAGEKKDFKFRTTVSVNTSDAQNIEIFRNGQKLDLSGGKGVQPKGICSFSIAPKN